MQINICQQMPGMLNQQLFTANYEAQKTASELMGRLDLTQQLWHCAQKRLSCNNKWKVVFFLFKAPTLWKTSSLCVWFVKERRIWLAPQFESRGINWRATSTNHGKWSWRWKISWMRTSSAQEKEKKNYENYYFSANQQSFVLHSFPSYFCWQKGP